MGGYIVEPVGKCLVPKAGFEPAHPGGRQTLNPHVQIASRLLSLRSVAKSKDFIEIGVT
ncbi:MAG: hypothetical protein NPIRA02_40190 [Nitrospirales bacterium]|nr:MAG: hypothetical protein NPIRA02_40190 [Nitrospirales bacterium]